MANITRYGERTADGAASFRCAACGELAGVVRATAGGAAATGPPLGTTTSDQDGFIVSDFIGIAWLAAGRAVLDAVRALIDEGSIDPLALRDIHWELAPFYCPDCQLNYCRNHWNTHVIFDKDLYDCTKGTCPNGHEHTVDD
jgi:hypothetical protein